MIRSGPYFHCLLVVCRKSCHVIQFLERISIRILVMLLCSLPAVDLFAQSCTNCSNGEGYWVVSTYAMPQTPGICPKSFNFRCYFKPVNGPMRPGSMSEMQSSLNPTAPTCMFVHGSFVDVDHALNEARFTYSWLHNANRRAPLNMIFFIWPSDDIDTVLPGRSVVHNGYRADHNGIYLAHLIDCLPATSSICLMGHSHGTRVIAAGLHYRGGGGVLNCVKPPCTGGCRTIRAIFAAAAINHEWLTPNEKFGRALCQVRCMLTLVNRKDVALIVYPLVGANYGRALSTTGTTWIDRNKLGPYANKVQEIDLTFEVGFRHAWAMYYSNPELGREISCFINRGCGNTGTHVQRDQSQEIYSAVPSDVPADEYRAPIVLPLPESGRISTEFEEQLQEKKSSDEKPAITALFDLEPEKTLSAPAVQK